MKSKHDNGCRRDHWQEAMLALAWLRHNASGEEVVRMAYREANAMHLRSRQCAGSSLYLDYIAKKAARWHDSPLSFYLGLDRENRRRFTEKLMDCYGHDAEVSVSWTD